VNDTFSSAGLIVNAAYSNGSAATVTDYTLSWNNAALAENSAAITASTGNKTITIAYRGQTATFAITVNPVDFTLTAITVAHPPAKTTYTQGEAFSPAGLVVNATYSDGGGATVTDYTLSWNGAALAKGNTAITAATGTKTVTVAYEGQTASFDILTNPPDTTPPADITNLNVAPGDGQADLTWTNPADEDFDHVVITVSPPAGSGQPITVAGELQSHTITDLANGTTYTFTVAAVDTAGNKSGPIAKTAIPVDPVSAIAEYLAAASGGNSVDNPVPLEAELNLTTKWLNLLSVIQTAEKYVSLDLAACAMADMTGAAGEFNPGTADTGKSLIVSLVLPAAATRIYGIPGQGAFRYFTSLKTIRGSAVTTLGEIAFSGCAALTTADFPLVTSIGGNAFTYTAHTVNKALVITLPQDAPVLSSSNNYNAPAYSKTVTVKTPAGRTGYDAAWEGLFKAAFGTDATITLNFENLE
jgi:hypothetical protein